MWLEISGEAHVDPARCSDCPGELDPLFPGLMGVRLTKIASDRVVAEMDVWPQLCTAGGILHGGAYMAFADTLGAVGTVLNLGAGKRTTTTDSSSKFIAGEELGSTDRGECVALHPTEDVPRWCGRRRSATWMGVSVPRSH